MPDLAIPSLLPCLVLMLSGSFQFVFFCPLVCLVVFSLRAVLNVSSERNSWIRVFSSVGDMEGGEAFCTFMIKSQSLQVSHLILVNLCLWTVNFTSISLFLLSPLRWGRMAGVDSLWEFPFSYMESKSWMELGISYSPGQLTLIISQKVRLWLTSCPWVQALKPRAIVSIFLFFLSFAFSFVLMFDLSFYYFENFQTFNIVEGIVQWALICTE